MKAIIFGATGMTGQSVLLECLDDPQITQVLTVVRRPTALQHPKLVEIIHTDFADYDGRLNRMLYTLMSPLTPALRATLLGYVTSSVLLARGMIRAAAAPGGPVLLGSREINELVGAERTG